MVTLQALRALVQESVLALPATASAFQSTQWYLPHRAGLEPWACPQQSPGLFRKLGLMFF